MKVTRGLGAAFLDLVHQLMHLLGCHLVHDLVGICCSLTSKSLVDVHLWDSVKMVVLSTKSCHGVQQEYRTHKLSSTLLDRAPSR
jgi:hypothetical protein